MKRISLTTVSVRKVKKQKRGTPSKKGNNCSFEHYNEEILKNEVLDEQSTRFYKIMMAEQPTLFTDYMNLTRSTSPKKKRGRDKLTKINQFTPR
jgi:hypothetical protein